MTPDSRKTRGHKDEDDVVSTSSNTSSVAEKAKTRKTPAQVKAESNARKARVIWKEYVYRNIRNIKKKFYDDIIDHDAIAVIDKWALERTS